MSTKEIALDWREHPEKYPDLKTQDDVAAFCHVTPSRITQILSSGKKKEQPEVIGDYFDTKSKAVDEALVKACEKGNAQALRTYYQLTQRLVEKREETHKFELSPADYTRIARETIGGLREEYQTSGGLCPICGVNKALLRDPCLDTEPEQSEDREVATLAVPARPD